MERKAKITMEPALFMKALDIGLAALKKIALPPGTALMGFDYDVHHDFVVVLVVGPGLPYVHPPGTQVASLGHFTLDQQPMRVVSDKE